MRRIKKCTVFLLVLCLLLNLAGCAAAQKPLRVTLVLKTVTGRGVLGNAPVRR